jgi:hypothetical protein
MITHTYVVMQVSPSTYKEINDKLLATGYHGHLIPKREYGTLLSMQGIALAVDSDSADESTTAQQTAEAPSSSDQ